MATRSPGPYGAGCPGTPCRRPARDAVMAWTYFTGDERKTFREAAGLPDDARRRARGRAARPTR
jgi:hypothetical protein